MGARAQIILWENIFAVVDDGAGLAADYETFGKLILKQCAKFPLGVGCLTIIPQKSKPPPPEVRAAINTALAALAGQLRCFCWLVEESGFEGATVRAVLTGLRMFGRFSYPTHISTTLDDSLTWMLPHLRAPDQWRTHIPSASAAIRSARESARYLNAPNEPGQV
ncbi:MAG: hypothetical protein M3O36_18070 [Myxococcota bacterium]|nr:hypothetical protein [Myxococcota bacterium]